jgi:hypothetical protein
MRALLIAIAVSLIACVLLLFPAPARANDFDTCLDAGEKVKLEGRLPEDDKQKAHAACQRALADSSNVVMKYHLQEADFAILGRPAH